MKFVTEPQEALERFFRKLSENDGRLHSTVRAAAMRHGGYIAGGAARRFLRILKMWQRNTAFDRASVREEWFSFMSSVREQGDVDFFFPNEESFYRAILDLRTECAVEPEESSTGAAMQFTVGNVKYQLVKFEFADPERMLASFDIVNACVAFTDDKVIYHERWEALEDAHELDVINWDRPHTICRVARYCQRFELDLHPHAAGLFADYAVKHVAALKKKPLPGHGRFRRPFVHRQLTQWMGTLLPKLKNADLVLLATAYSEEKYNWALEELFKRSPVVPQLEEKKT